MALHDADWENQKHKSRLQSRKLPAFIIALKFK